MIPVMIVLFSLIGLGFWTKKSGILPKNTEDVLVKIVVNITVPVVIILSLIENKVEAAHLNIWMTSILSMIACLLIIAIGFKFIFKDRKLYGTAVPIAFFNNTGFFGIPIILNLFGEKGVSYVPAFQLGGHNAIWIFFIGGLFFSYYASNRKKSSWREILKKVLLSPILLSIPAGILLGLVPLPSFLLETFKTVGSANTFIVMFAVGFMLNPNKISKKLIGPALLISATNLALVPLVTFLAGNLVGLASFELKFVTIEAAMPMAVLTLVLIKEYKLKVELAETVLFITMIASIFTLPFVWWMMESV